MGQPMKMAELIASSTDRSTWSAWRCYDNKQRNKAKKAIKKALQLQVENRASLRRGARRVPDAPEDDPGGVGAVGEGDDDPVFPLGVKKDEQREPLAVPRVADVRNRAGDGGPSAHGESPCRASATGSPPRRRARHLLKLAGAGGDGAQTAAMLIARAGINEGFDATHIPSYGPESRAARRTPTSTSPPTRCCPGLAGPERPGCLQRAEPRQVRLHGARRAAHRLRQLGDPRRAALAPGVKAVGVPFTEIAASSASSVVKNVVALGALQAATGLFPEQTFLAASGRR
jgi:2-oxoisovalerate ferredoxin oxidoreductase beta subunit